MQREVKLHFLMSQNAPGSIACFKFHAALTDAIGIPHPAWEVQSESRQVFHFGEWTWDGTSERVDGPLYFFFVRCLEISPVPSQTGQTLPSFRLVPRPRAHRTDTNFLLLAGVPIDQVPVLLGHRSVKMTEKHYLSERVTIHGKVAMRFKLGRQRTSDVVCLALMFVQCLYNRIGIGLFRRCGHMKIQ